MAQQQRIYVYEIPTIPDCTHHSLVTLFGGNVREHIFRASEHLLRMIANFFSRFTPQRNIESIQHNLDLAGNPYGWSPREFMGLRMIAALICAGLFLGLMIAIGSSLLRKIGVTAIAGAFGYFLPILWLRLKISRRQSNILRALPDALDLLTISVEAGLGFDAAMTKVTEKWTNDLSEAFVRVLVEIQMGKLRREALRAMADRCEVPDLTSFVAAIIQADQLGVSLARVLRIQSEQMRIRRRQRAEELAHQAPIKMMIPLVFLIFPALFIVLLGPALPKLLEALGGV